MNSPTVCDFGWPAISIERDPALCYSASDKSSIVRKYHFGACRFTTCVSGGAKPGQRGRHTRSVGDSCAGSPTRRRCDSGGWADISASLPRTISSCPRRKGSQPGGKRMRSAPGIPRPRSGSSAPGPPGPGRSTEDRRRDRQAPGIVRRGGRTIRRCLSTEMTPGGRAGPADAQARGVVSDAPGFRTGADWCRTGRNEASGPAQSV